MVDRATALRLCAVNNDFYRANAASFSATRSAPWEGWGCCLDIVREVLGGELTGGERGASDEVVRRVSNGEACEKASEPTESVALRELSIFDLACGNLRFEAFLARELPDAALTCHAVDSCDELACEVRTDGAMPTVRYQSLDALAALFAEEGAESLSDRLSARIEAPLCDMAVAFGFLHHVPTFAARVAVIRALVGQVRPGGVVCVSFWQFMDDERLARKAFEVHERARAELGLPTLDEGDWLLGWRNEPGAWRYCHHFTDAEIDALAESLAGFAQPIARFHADGASGRLNAYLVLQRNS